MPLMLFLIGLLPLILFVLVDFYTRSIRASITTAIITSVIMFGVSWFFLQRIDWELIAVIVTMLITGLVSIQLKNTVYFKFQPVITGVMMAGVLGYFHFYDTPLPVKILPDAVKVLEGMEDTPADYIKILQDESQIARFTRLSRSLIVLILIHAGFVAWSALRSGNFVWLIIKAMGLPFIAVGALLMEMLWH